MMRFRACSCLASTLLLATAGGLVAYFIAPRYLDLFPKAADTPWPPGLPLITREDWGVPEIANPVNAIFMDEVRRITIHHDGMPPLPMITETQIEKRIVAIRDAHSQRFADISYHYIVDPLGRIWEGRPVKYQGAHVKGENEHNLGILFLGNTFDDEPTEKGVNALCEFIRFLRQRHGIAREEVRTHRELAPTGCPGDKLQKRIDQARKEGLLDPPETGQQWRPLWNWLQDFARERKENLERLKKSTNLRAKTGPLRDPPDPQG